MGIIHECDFKQRTKGRKHGQEDRGSHFRKKAHGDWLNHFTLEHPAEFKQRYEDLLFQLGYESEPDRERQYIPLIEQRACRRSRPRKQSSGQFCLRRAFARSKLSSANSPVASQLWLFSTPAPGLAA
ncbi:MAG: hypothetical protein R2748_01260 [Bryobacterales bacterium]